MNTLSLKLGYWAAVLSIVTGIGYGVGLIVVFAIFPSPPWTTLAEYAASISSANLTAGSLSQFMGFLSIPLNVILFCSIHDLAQGDRRTLTRIALSFVLCYASLGGITYFLQFTTVRVNIAQGHLQGLEHFVEANPTSAVNAIGVLGWNVFLGLAFLFVAPVFSGSRLEKALQTLFWIEGIISILGGLGYAAEVYVIYALYLIGIASAGTVLVILLAIFFRRKLKSTLAPASLRP